MSNNPNITPQQMTAIDQILAGFEAQEIQEDFDAAVLAGKLFAPDFEVFPATWYDGEMHYVIKAEKDFREGFMKDLREVNNITSALFFKSDLIFVSVKSSSDDGASIRDIIYTLYQPF